MIDVRPAEEYVDVLRAQDFRAHRLELGVAEWRAAGGRVQVGATPGSPP